MSLRAELQAVGEMAALKSIQRGAAFLCHFSARLLRAAFSWPVDGFGRVSHRAQRARLSGILKRVSKLGFWIIKLTAILLRFDNGILLHECR